MYKFQQCYVYTIQKKSEDMTIWTYLLNNGKWEDI